MVGTYEGLLWLCEWRLGGDCTSRYSHLAPSLPPTQPLAPTEVVGTPKHSITYPYPPLAIGSEGGARGARGSKMGVRGANRWLIGLLPLIPLTPSHSLFLFSLPLAPSCSPHSLSLPSLPLAPQRATWCNFHYLIFLYFGSPLFERVLHSCCFFSNVREFSKLDAETKSPPC